MQLLYSCLFGYIFFFFFFVLRAHWRILTVNFFITSYPAPLCHQPPQKVFDSQSSKSFVWKNKISRSPKCKIMLWIVMWLESKIWAKWANAMNYLSIHLEVLRKKKKAGEKDIWQIYDVTSVQTPAVWSVPTQRSTHASIIPRLL